MSVLPFIRIDIVITIAIHEVPILNSMYFVHLIIIKILVYKIKNNFEVINYTPKRN